MGDTQKLNFSIRIISQYTISMNLKLNMQQIVTMKTSINIFYLRKKNSSHFSSKQCLENFINTL